MNKNPYLTKEDVSFRLNYSILALSLRELEDLWCLVLWWLGESSNCAWVFGCLELRWFRESYNCDWVFLEDQVISLSLKKCQYFHQRSRPQKSTGPNGLRSRRSSRALDTQSAGMRISDDVTKIISQLVTFYIILVFIQSCLDIITYGV